jgi:hypothetical protein
LGAVAKGKGKGEGGKILKRKTLKGLSYKIDFENVDEN